MRPPGIVHHSGRGNKTKTRSTMRGGEGVALDHVWIAAHNGLQVADLPRRDEGSGTDIKVMMLSICSCAWC